MTARIADVLPHHRCYCQGSFSLHCLEYEAHHASSYMRVLAPRAAAGKKVLWRAAERCFGVPPKKPPKNEIKATLELPGLPDYVAAPL